MPERVLTGLPETPLVVREGISFTPFEDLKKLPLPDEYETFVESVDYVASVQISFGALAFTLALTVPEDIYYPDTPHNFETPLGPVDLHHRLLGGQERGIDSERAITTSLEICSLSTIDALKNYIALSNYELEIRMGDSIYYLDCVKQMKVDEAGEIINARVIEENGGGHFVSGELRDSEGNGKDVILPYDVEKLSTIAVKIVRKPEA